MKFLDIINSMSQCHSSSTVQFAFDDKNHKPQDWLSFGNACRPHSDLKKHSVPNYTLPWSDWRTALLSLMETLCVLRQQHTYHGARIGLTVLFSLIENWALILQLRKSFNTESKGYSLTQAAPGQHIHFHQKLKNG